MKVRVGAGKAAFARKHEPKVRAVMRNHYAEARKLISRRVAARALGDFAFPQEFIEAVRTRNKVMANQEMKPRFSDLLWRAGNEAMSAIEAARKSESVWTVGNLARAVAMESKAFNPITDRVLRYITEEAEYFEVEFTAEMIATLQQTLVKAVSAEWSVSTLELMMQNFVGLTSKQAEIAIRQYDAMLEELTKQGVGSMEATRQANQHFYRYSNNLERIRRETIARTETARAYNFGNNESVQQAIDAGIAKGAVKVWHANLDDRVRDEHANMDGERVPIDEAFSNGEQFPSAINCRCWVEYEVEV